MTTQAHENAARVDVIVPIRRAGMGCAGKNQPAGAGWAFYPPLFASPALFFGRSVSIGAVVIQLQLFSAVTPLEPAEVILIDIAIGVQVGVDMILIIRRERAT